MTIRSSCAAFACSRNCGSAAAPKLVVGIHEETDGYSDPIPQAAIQGRDVLDASKDGHLYKAGPDGKMRLMKTGNAKLYLRIEG